jgi:mannose-6-phosphate isomerase-like protein (cupin superfamily)
VIGLTHNRRSQGGDVLLPAGFATRVAGCKHVCTRFSLHADSFAPSHLHPHPMRCFFFVGGVGVAWLAGRALCMQAGESEVAARVASDLSHMAMV